LENSGGQARKISLYAALRPLGPAGGPVRQLSVSEDGTSLLVDSHSALVPNRKPAAVGVAPRDAVGELAMKGELPTEKMARSETGDCSGALRFDLTIAPGEGETVSFLCPVLPGRRAVRHQWDGTSTWAQLDLAAPNPKEGGVLQPDPGLAYYKSVDTIAAVLALTTKTDRRVTLALPDKRWAECFAAIVGHAGLEMNEGAPDVAAINYNVFNRDGVYVANILQKAGHPELAAEAIDYFLKRPFNGRVQCEADNPGQVLWILGQHWLFTHDRAWLDRVYASAAKLAAMVRYYRTTPPPHYVKAASLDFGDALPPDRPEDKPADRRQVLRPGSCDGHHPEYTEAFDIAGLRAAAILARAADKQDEATSWEKLAAELAESYDKRFGPRLAKDYGSYSVLWPCRLYSLDSDAAGRHFAKIGVCNPTGWRYFPLATAHQGLLAGNRTAGHGTLTAHLAHPQMQGWYAFDEGGGSGTGAWRFARTTWKPGVAMPHGWAIAEMFLLLRDCLVFEDGQRLVLLAGIPVDWFKSKTPWRFSGLPTHFGDFSLHYTPTSNGAVLRLDGKSLPPKGFVVKVPGKVRGVTKPDGKQVECRDNGDCLLPPATREVHIEWLPEPGKR
jgi:hypothetical protein